MVMQGKCPFATQVHIVVTPTVVCVKYIFFQGVKTFIFTSKPLNGLIRVIILLVNISFNLILVFWISISLLGFLVRFVDR